ncbi:MAG: tetratricopeptide repeat protein [Burkholderiaceae bacterium]|nr:tetratricopeptide repeat protein [Burkholderiaceae bacterium]
MNSKLGRNDPCPCGSGRKYKQCCLSGPAAPRAAGTGVSRESLETDVERGNLLQDQGRFEEALACFRQALKLKPDFVELNLNIGLSHQKLGRSEEAIASYRLALAQPRVALQAYNNLGMALREAGRLEEAISNFRLAVALDPSCIEAMHGLGAALLAQGRVAEAISTLRRALALDPSQASVHSALLLALLYSDTEAPRRVRSEHHRFADRFETPLTSTIVAHANVRDPERRLRVGYVSADFRSHSVAFFTEPVLAHHDRSQFEITCYYNSACEDAVTMRLRAMADRWLPCSTYSDEQLAQRIRADRIDVLVDLSGHTSGNRLLVFARKPAPLQLGWIGYPSTTGLRGIDWRLTDDRVSPPRERSESDSDADMEPLHRLPDVFSCYRPSPNTPDVQPAPALAAGHVTLGSFNNVAKISDGVVRVWAALLQTSPSLHLLLKDRSFADTPARDWMGRRFAAHGVGTDRLTMLARAEAEAEHLRLYGRIDIALDTFPYCGTTTTCEALWMGVPVVTLAGDTFAGRVGVTLLETIGHPEWVARNEGDYIQSVLRVASDVAALNGLRMGLRDSVRGSRLCQEANFTRALESAYRAMWRRWCAGAATGQGAAARSL